MASAFGHALAAYTASRFFPSVLMKKRVIFLAIFSAIMPDFDVLSFRFGIPYEDMFGHRGITHSIPFAAVWAMILIPIFHIKEKRSDQIKLYIFYFIATVSHTLLDSCTTGGEGVAFLAPFDDTRYFSPFKVIKVSPMSISRFFSKWGWRVLASEAIYIGIPCLAIIIITRFKRLRS